MTSWSISIKTVGGRFRRRADADETTTTTKERDDDDGDGAATTKERGDGDEMRHHDRNIMRPADVPGSDFTVTVSPDDPLRSLHDRVSEATGLKAEEMRLIYRGRILCAGGGGDDDLGGGGGGDPATTAPSPGGTGTSRRRRVRDVAGLCDRQTIHLVPRGAVPPPGPGGGDDARDGRRGTDRLPDAAGVGVVGVLRRRHRHRRHRHRRRRRRRRRRRGDDVGRPHASPSVHGHPPPRFAKRYRRQRHARPSGRDDRGGSVSGGRFRGGAVVAAAAAAGGAGGVDHDDYIF